MSSTNLQRINIHSFNCRGLRDKAKRNLIFTWLKEKNKGITLLQETHSTRSDEKMWEKEWGGTIYYSHGCSNSSGVAVLIPPTLGLDFKCDNIDRDNDGRILLLSCRLEGNIIIIINVYAPTKDKIVPQNLFLEDLKRKVDLYCDKNIIIGGNLNTYLDLSLDKKGGTMETTSKYCNNLKNMMSEYSLVDIWRHRNTTLTHFTRREKSHNGIVQSRLDYWLVSCSLEYLINKAVIKPGYHSDHSIITIELELVDTQRRGRGYWKFNNSLLNDKQYVTLIKDTISSVLANTNYENKNLLWEYLKCQMRTETISFAGKRAKQQKDKENYLEKQLHILEKDIDKSEDNFLHYKTIKSEWENIQTIKLNGIILRSKAQWVEFGEKKSKYFLNLTKRNYNLKYIKKIIKANGTEVVEPFEVINEQKAFYTNLYKSRIDINNLNTENKFLKNPNIPKLDAVNKEYL